MNPVGSRAPDAPDTPGALEPTPPVPPGSPPQADQWTVRTWVATVGINARTIQVVLGCLWILDGALQFQPSMFHTAFVSNVIMPNVTGQPAPIAWLITNAAHFIRPDVGVWNFLFAVIQLSLGVGMLFRRTLRPALALSCVWAVGVWAVGEGFGGLLTGTASPLMGAPGAVILYALLAVLVWPRKADAEPSGAAPVGVASSAGATGPLGAAGALAVWCAVWVGAAVLWLLPANRAHGAISTMVAGMANGEPSWYGHFLTTFAGHFAGIGPQTSWVLAIVSLVIGVGPLVVSRPAPFLVAGAALMALYWVTGMALGAIMSGTGTDPNAGPLVILLALALLPTAVYIRASVNTPIASLVRWHPLATGGVMAATLGALLLSATYPVAASAATASGNSQSIAVSTHHVAAQGSSVAGMAGMDMTSGSSGKGGSSTSSHDTANSMSMSGMAGLNVTQANWKYTGPPLPAREVQLLTNVGTATDKGHKMQTPGCNSPPTSGQTLGAVQYVQAVTSAVAKYKVLSAATVAGYFPVTNTSYPVVHYVNAAYMNTQDMLKPNTVDSLVYATTPTGPVLVAAMFLMGSMTTGPMPYGCLVQWHAHTNLCTSLSTGLIDGFTPCGAGTVHKSRTGYMTHVWQVPVSGGPLAMDPSTVMVVEAAIMAQDEGLAPITAKTGTVSYKTTSPTLATRHFRRHLEGS